MPSSPPSVCLRELSFTMRPAKTRFPFQYGIASMTEAPHLFLKATMEIDGLEAPVTGISGEGLPPKWFTKNPTSTFEEDLPGMLAAIRHAGETAISLQRQPSLFSLWRALYQEQHAWAEQNGVPFLLAHLGTSLIERALIDTFCRGTGRSFHEAVQDNTPGIDLETLHPELAGTSPTDWLKTPAPDQPIIARHTVGLGDPLTAGDIPPDEEIHDGLPYSLEDCIQTYGLTHFKIKIRGQIEPDRERLRRLATLLDKSLPGGYFYTLDGNEQYRGIRDFRETWEAYRSDPLLADFLSPPRLLFVEQPVHRDEALATHVKEDLAAWTDAPPLIIDESDATLNSVRDALELGYRGSSHKNCKGVFKGIANACLLAHHREAHPNKPTIQSGEDLANIGPVALLQDLAAMHLLGIRHVERNGHHYYAGLSMFPEPVQAAVLEKHADLYRPHTGPNGTKFPSLKIDAGSIDLASVHGAPFGCALSVEELSLLGDWKPLRDLAA